MSMINVFEDGQKVTNAYACTDLYDDEGDGRLHLSSSFPSFAPFTCLCFCLAFRFGSVRAFALLSNLSVLIQFIPVQCYLSFAFGYGLFNSWSIP